MIIDWILALTHNSLEALYFLAAPLPTVPRSILISCWLVLASGTTLIDVDSHLVSTRTIV